MDEKKISSRGNNRTRPKPNDDIYVWGREGGICSYFMIISLSFSLYCSRSRIELGGLASPSSHGDNMLLPASSMIVSLSRLVVYKHKLSTWTTVFFFFFYLHLLLIIPPYPPQSSTSLSSYSKLNSLGPSLLLMLFSHHVECSKQSRVTYHGSSRSIGALHVPSLLFLHGPKTWNILSLPSSTLLLDSYLPPSQSQT